MRKKNFVNHYKILNVSSQVTKEELRRAYLKLVKIYHPDRNKGRPLAERKFRQINLAWEALKDPLKKKEFDLTLKAQEDLKRQINKSRDFQKTGLAGKEIDLEIPVKLSLEEICQSRKKSFSYFKPVNGLREKSVFEFKVPQRVKENTRLRFKKKGGSEAKAPYGDLYVKIKVRSHKLFKPRDNPFDLLLEQPVSVISAFQNSSLYTPSPYGFLTLEVEPPLKNEQLLKAEGFGLIKNNQGEKGDLFIKILIDYPLNQGVKIKEKLKTLSLESQKSYIEALAEDSLVFPKVLKFEKKVQEIKLKYYSL